MSRHKSDIEKGNFWIRTALLAQMGHLSKVYGSKQEGEELLIRSFERMKANKICPARLGDSVLIRPDLALGIDHPIVKLKGLLQARKPLPRDWCPSFSKWIKLAQ